MLKSPDRLNVPKALTLLAFVATFVGGCWSNQWWSAHKAEAHYVDQIRELLRKSDHRQLKRPYVDAVTYYRRSYFVEHFARIHHVLLRADEERVDVEKAISDAVIDPLSPVPPAIQGITAINLKNSFDQAREYGLYDGLVNRIELFNGNRPTVRKGDYQGREAEVDHILPSSVFPQLAQLAVNLQWLSEPENITKDDHVVRKPKEDNPPELQAVADVSVDAVELLRYLLETGIISRATVEDNLKAVAAKSPKTADEWREVVESITP